MRSPIIWFNQTFFKKLIDEKVKQAMKIHPVYEQFFNSGNDGNYYYVVIMYVYYLEHRYGTGSTLKEAYDKANQARYNFYHELFSKKPNFKLENLKQYDKRNNCESDD